MSPQDFVKSIREQDPIKFRGMNDNELYQWLQDEYPDKRWPTFNPPVEKNQNLTSLESHDTSPGFFEWLATTNVVTDKMMDEGAFGGSISADFFRSQYNNSLPGFVYKSIHGEDRYQLKDEDYNPDFKAQAAQFALGLLSPIELATFAVSGFGGAKAASYLGKFAMNGLKAGVGGATTGKVLTSNMVQGAVEMGVSGSAYAAAHGAVHSAAEQKEQFGSIDSGKVFYDAGSSFIESLPLFMATGGVVKGVMGTMHGYSAIKAKTDPTFGNKLNKLLTGQVPQVGVEAALFSSLPAVLNMEGAASFGSDEWWTEFAKNTMIIGGLRGFQRVWKGAQETDAIKVLSTTAELDGVNLKNVIAGKKAVASELDIPNNEILRSIVLDEATLAGAPKEVKIFKKDAKRLTEILEKLDDSEYLKKWDKGEPSVLSDIEFVLKKGAPLTQQYRGAVDHILKQGDSFIKEIHRKNFPEIESTDTRIKVFKEALNNQKENIDLAFKDLNKVARGDVQGAKEGEKQIVETPKFERKRIAGDVEETWSAKPKNNIISKYNEMLNRHIATNFPDAKPSRVQQIKDSFVADKNMTKKELAAKLFRLEDNIKDMVQRKGPISDVVAKTKVGESIKEIKQGVEPTNILETKVGKSASFWRVSKDRQKKIVEIDKQINERKSTDKLDNNKQKVYEDNKSIIRDMLVNSLMRAKAQNRKTILSIDSVKEKINTYHKLNDYATSLNKRIFELNEFEIRDFMQGKEVIEATAIFNIVQRHKTRFSDEGVRNLSAVELQTAAAPVIETTKGFKTDYLVDSKTGRLKDTVGVTTGKYGKEKGVPLTVKLKQSLFSMFKKNKTNKTSYRHKQEGVYDSATQKYINVYHEFLFTDTSGKAINATTGGKILKALTGTDVYKNIFGDRKLTQDMMRDSFVTFVKSRAKGGKGFTRDTLLEAADAFVLGHSTGLAGRYMQFTPAVRKSLQSLLDKYERIIDGKIESTKLERGTKKHISPHELRELLKAVDQVSDVATGNVRIGNSIISKDTIKGLISYQAQSGGRVSEVLPTSKYLTEIGYTEGFKKFSKGKEYKKGPGDKTPPGTGGQGGMGVDITNMSIKEGKRIVNQVFDEVFKKADIEGRGNTNKRKDIKQFVYENAGLGENFIIGKDITSAELNSILVSLNRIDPYTVKSTPQQRRFFKLQNRTEQNRLNLGITDKSEIKMLKDLGVKDGNVWKASTEQIESYASILYAMKPEKKGPSTWLDDAISSGIMKADQRKRINTALGMKKFSFPIHTVLESVGLSKLSKKMLNHVSSELNHAGQLFDFEYYAKGVVGRRKFNKIKEHLSMLDKERYFERLKSNTLKPEAKKFINSAMDTKTWKPKGTPEGDVVKLYVKLMKYYKNSTLQAIKQSMNKAEFEKFEKSGYIKWINADKNIFVTRRLSKKFMESYDTGKIEKLIIDQSEHIARSMAKEKYKTETPTREQIGKFKTEAYDIAEAEISSLFEFSSGKYSSSFMKSRNLKLPEFLNGIEVYETGYNRTVQHYVNGMGKFLANLEHFPEYVNLKGFKYPGVKKNVLDIKKIDPRLGEWVERKVKQHLDIERPTTEYKTAVGAVQHYTSTIAKLQLSFPTSGLKNLLVGNSQTILAFKMRHYLGGIFDAISTDNRRMVRSMSATELGMRHFDEGLGAKLADKYIFKFGFMKPSESLNRYFAVLTSIRAQAELGKILKTAPEKSKRYKNAITRLDKFYKLTAEEIALIKKHGMKPENVDIKEFKGSYEHAQAVRKLKVINEKMTTLAHINTQGASIDLFMPEWASGPLYKSLLLYKRMAYAATVNTVRNSKLAWETGSPLAFAFFGLGTYLSGESLIWVYENLLGTTMPHRNSNAGKQMQTTLWKGEFMGLLSEFMNPAWGKSNVEFLAKPAVIGQIGLMSAGLQNIWKGKKFWLEGKSKGVGQMVDEIGRGSIGLYNGIAKVREKTLNQYHKDGSKFRKLRKEYNAEMAEAKDYNPDTSLYSQFEKSKYSSAFWDMWHLGSDADRAKWYVLNLFAKATDMYREGRAPGIIEGETIPVRNWNEAMVQAKKDMKRTVTDLNPAKDIQFKKDGSVGITDRRQIGFYKWLAKKEYEALKRKNPKLALTSKGKSMLWKEAFKLNKDIKSLMKIKSQYGERRRRLAEFLPKYIEGQNIDVLLSKFGLSRAIL
jgi:hypothetical protein